MTEGDSFKIVCFLASVVTNEARLECFSHLLESIKRQSVPLDGLFVSVHFADSLNVDVSQFFENIPCKLRLLKQKRPKPQFVQFREMYDRLAQNFGEKDVNIMFSDDDDIWHEHRVYSYKRSFELSSVEKREMLSSFVCLESTAQKYCTAHERSCFNVQTMLDCGCCIHKQYDRPIFLEYHYYVIKSFVLGDFFKQKRWFVENNRFADMEFRCFVAEYKPEEGFHTAYFTPPTWTYFYRFSGTWYPSVTCQFQLQDFRPEFMFPYLNYLVEMLEAPSMDQTAKKQYDAVMHIGVKSGMIALFQKTFFDLISQRKKLRETQYGEQYTLNKV